jgi:hypothetical protein
MKTGSESLFGAMEMSQEMADGDRMHRGRDQQPIHV